MVIKITIKIIITTIATNITKPIVIAFTKNKTSLLPQPPSSSLNQYLST